MTSVLICGAGAAGLTLAIELARRQVPFRLVEKSDRPFPGSRGKGLQPRSQEVFEDMGVVDRLFACGELYPTVRRHDPDGMWTDTALGGAGPTPAEPYQQALLVPQFATERVLRERLAELGHRVEFGCELRGFTQDESGVTATLATAAGDESVRCAWLAGTDGGRSVVRQALAIDFPGKTLGVRAVVADVVLTGLARDAWHRFNDDDMQRQISLCPLPATDLSQLQAPVPMEGDVDVSAAGLGEMVRTRTGRDDLDVGSVRWASAYTMNARLADRYRVGRVFIVGDAAHVHPPTGGQGLNTSVQDACNLGWKLAAVVGGAPASLLDSYEAERRPVAADMLGLSTRLLDAARRGEMKRGREVQQLDLGYPDSPLSLPSSRPADIGVQPGQRAPDAPVTGAAGQRRRLFDLFAGVHWTLLGIAAAPDAIAARAGLRVHVVGPQGDLRDDGGHVADAYALSPGDWVLVRPDGYVAAVVATSELAALDALLATVGVASPSPDTLHAP